MRSVKLVFCIFLSVAPLVYLAIVWNQLPAVVPTHFDATGEPNDYSSKGMLWVINGFLSLLSIGMYVFFNNLHRIDPKRRGKIPSGAFENLADGLVLFLSAINFLAVLASAGHQIAMTKLIFPLIGLLFAFLGNMMLSIKPNHFVGVRLPWTLADDANWKATHRIAGVVWFAGGLLLTISAMVLRMEYVSRVMFIVLVPMVLIPTIYSYWFFKRSNSNNS